MVNSNYASKPHFRQRLLALSVLVTSLSFINSAHALPDHQDWQRLFFEAPITTSLSGHIYAYKDTNDHKSAVISFDDNKMRFIHVGDIAQRLGEPLTVERIEPNKILFKNSLGLLFSLENPSSEQTVIAQSTVVASPSRMFTSKRRSPQRPAAIPVRGPMYSVDTFPKGKLVDLALVIGIPKQFAHLAAKYLKPARSRGGRPGWRLTSPDSLLDRFGVGLNEGDVLLALDGIPVQKLELVQAHIADRQKGQIFSLEVQRNNKLIIVEFKE